MTSYIRPQENANRSDVRWVAFTSEAGKGLMALGVPQLSVSAWPYTQKELQHADHTYDLSKNSASITINLDYRQMGVGGDDSWSAKARPHLEYRLSEPSYTYDAHKQPHAVASAPLPVQIGASSAR